MAWIKRWVIGIAVPMALAIAAPTADAAATNYTWSGLGSSDDWSTPGNWSPGAPTAPIGTLTLPDLNGQ